MRSRPHGTERLGRLLVSGLVTIAIAACGGAVDGDGDDGVGATTSVTDRLTTTSTAAPTTTTEAVRVIEVGIVGGRPEGGPRREQVDLGGTVRLVVHSDVADEVHVHTYDLRVDVPAGGTAEIEFVADIPGVIEVELEERHTAILTLEIRPG